MIGYLSALLKRIPVKVQQTYLGAVVLFEIALHMQPEQKTQVDS